MLSAFYKYNLIKKAAAFLSIFYCMGLFNIILLDIGHELSHLIYGSQHGITEHFIKENISNHHHDFLSIIKLLEDKKKNDEEKHQKNNEIKYLDFHIHSRSDSNNIFSFIGIIQTNIVKYKPPIYSPNSPPPKILS